MAPLIKISGEPDIPAGWRASSIGAWIRRAALGGPPPASADGPPLLLGLCPHDAPRPPLSDEHTFVLDCGGAEFRLDDFSVSHAVAVGGVRAVILVGCRLCPSSAEPLRAEARRLQALYPKIAFGGIVFIPEEGVFLVHSPAA